MENFSKYKELLNNLFKESFENKLKALETKSKSHLLIISTTKELANNIMTLSINMRNQILKKNKKENSVNKYKKKSTFKNIYSPKSSFIKTSTRLKTPLKPDKNKIRNNEIKASGNSKNKDSKIKNKLTHKFIHSNKELNKTLERTKTFKNNRRFSKTFYTETDKKNKTFMSSFHTKNNKNYTKRNSLSYLKIKYKEKEKIKNLGNKNDNNSVRKNLNKTFDKKRSKNIKNDNSSSSSQTAQKNKKNNINEKSKSNKDIQYYTNNINEAKNNNLIKLNYFESNLQQDNSFFQDDSLLITPLNDNDFSQHDLILRKNELKAIKRNIIDYFSNKDEKNIEIIFEFLSKNDLIQLKNVSKYFNKNILNYFLRYLNETKNNLEKIKKETIKKYSKNFKDFVFSKGTIRANELLNEAIMSKFFKEQNPPRNDILFIYEVFFQLINNPIINLNYNKNEFWKNCRDYFLNECKGKIGDLIKDIVINNKIDTSEENLYKIYELVKNKLNIILPSYFNKVSGITALISFSIKDILNFLGISTEKQDIKLNGYWTYSKIINSIDNKINMIIKYK